MLVSNYVIWVDMRLIRTLHVYVYSKDYAINPKSKVRMKVFPAMYIYYMLRQTFLFVVYPSSGM